MRDIEHADDATCSLLRHDILGERLDGSGQRDDAAIDLMTQFAARTGITGERAQRRYLWTDAFAVCNFVGFTARRAMRCPA